MKKYEVVLHYGDTGFEENVSGDTYIDIREAEHTARKCNDYMDTEDYEKGDYYYVKEIKPMKTLTKKQKADIFAYALNFGWNDYFDQCEWVPHLHKYRYVNAQEDTTRYYSQKEFAFFYDNELTNGDQRDLTEGYFEHMNTLKLRGIIQ